MKTSEIFNINKSIKSLAKSLLASAIIAGYQHCTNSSLSDQEKEFQIATYIPIVEDAMDKVSTIIKNTASQCKQAKRKCAEMKKTSPEAPATKKRRRIAPIPVKNAKEQGNLVIAKK